MEVGNKSMSSLNIKKNSAAVLKSANALRAQ